MRQGCFSSARPECAAKSRRQRRSESDRRAREGAGGAWISREDQSDERFIRAARSIHYPVMIKPVARCGGIGMQTINEEAQLRDGLARARRIATSAFGDERLLLERLIQRPRHIEVQVLADDHGAVLSVGDRDCSTRDAIRKIVEEAPAWRPDDKGRERMAAHAIAIAQEAGYRNAGTVEFVVDDRGKFYFLEVNAPPGGASVTEMVYGVDLVEQQLRIVMGERLDVQPVRHGRQHAVEARIYAEDPASGFLPSTGRLVPRALAGARGNPRRRWLRGRRRGDAALRPTPRQGHRLRRRPAHRARHARERARRDRGARRANQYPISFARLSHA